MKRLFLRSLKRELNEAAQKKLDEYRNQSDEEPTDEEGRTLSWFEDMNIRPPKSLLDKQKQFDEGLELDLEEDYDWFEVDITINQDQFEMVEDDIEEGSIVHLKSGKYLEVIEDSGDINAQIWYNNRSTWEKIKEWYYIQKNKFNNKKKTKNKLIKNGSKQ